MIQKGLAVAVILLFIGVNIVPSTAVQEFKEKPFPISYDGNTLYVGGTGPNNYTTIQSAIDDAVDGDTVFVYDDSSPYYECITVDKSIDLLGESRDTTIIDGGKVGDVVNIYADEVSISEFTIQNSSDYYDHIFGIFYVGLRVKSNRSTIHRNIIRYNTIGIYVIYSSNNVLSDNRIENNTHPGIIGGCGIFIVYSSHHLISGNIFLKNEVGCEVSVSNNTIVTKNTVTENGVGISLKDSMYTTVSNNNVFDNGQDAVKITGDNNTVVCNTIRNNGNNGIYLGGSNNNLIIGNFISNCLHHGICVSGASSNNHIYLNVIMKSKNDNACSFGISSNNSWDNGKIGNYWDDYKNHCPDGHRSFPRFWIWNTPYEIYGHGNNIDRYPFVGSLITFLLLFEKVLDSMGVLDFEL